MSSRKLNPALWVTIGLPLFAIIASVGTAVIAVTRGDAPLPGQYHWEGDKLDQDFAQSRHADELHLAASVDLRPRQGSCDLTLSLQAVNLPSLVILKLIHGADSRQDRILQFHRAGSSNSYHAECVPLPGERWYVELTDADNSWSFRGTLTGQARVLEVSSGSHAGGVM